MERRSDIWFLWIGLGILSLGLAFAHAGYRQGSDGPMIQEKRRLVRTLGLTDLCLFTDARYTRNPVMADLNTPFQDHPMSLEHFPSASLLGVPPHLTHREEALAENAKPRMARQNAPTDDGAGPPTSMARP